MVKNIFLRACAILPIFAVMASALPAPHALEARNPHKFDLEADIAALVGKIEKFCHDHLEVVNIELEKNICASASGDLELKATGVINIDLKATLKEFTFKLDKSLQIGLLADIDTTFGPDFYEKLQAGTKMSVTGICKSGPDFHACLGANSAKVAANVGTGISAILKKSQGQLELLIRKRIDTSIQLTLKEIGVNLLIENISLTGQAKFSESVKTSLDIWTSSWGSKTGLTWTDDLALIIAAHAKTQIGKYSF